MKIKLVGLYARISEDPNDTRAGVERQREDSRKIAELRGWEVAEEYIDNDLSAYKRKVKRPRFEQMLVDLAEGKIDGIVAYDLDRFVRQPRDLERAIDIYEDRKGLVFATAQGDINLQTADGRTMARVMVAFANKSSADTARRVARKHLEIAQTGRPVGGFRPFGWQEDRATLDPEEAVAVREAVEKVVAGGTLRGVCRAWNEVGLLTTAGGQWKPATLRQYLRSPRLIGLRTHQREVLLDDEGHPVKGLWEPMLDQDQWDRLQAVLTKPERRSRVPRRGARHYFLTGILRCGVCGGVMYGNKVGDTHYYACKGNGHTNTASGQGSDESVAWAILSAVEGTALDAQPVEWDGEQKMAEVQVQIDQLMGAFMDGTLSADVVFPRVKRLEQEKAEMQESRTRWLTATTGPAIERVTPERWEQMDTDDRRAVAEAMIEAVLVRPATQRGNRFDPTRLSLVWKQPESRPALAAVPS